MSPPDLDFLGQPLEPNDAAGALLARILGDPEYDELVIVVAWARFRGLWRLRNQLEAFKARGQSTIVLGIDEGGATRPGLLIAIELFRTAYVFHDERPGTFHPKLYLARGKHRARLVVGSSNMTPGGLYTNVEASLDASFDLATEADHPALLKANAFVEGLLDQPDACSELTPRLVDDLVASTRYRVSGVERRRADATQWVDGGMDPTDIDQETREASSNDVRLFGSATFPSDLLPALDDEGRAHQAELEVADSEAQAAEGRPLGTETTPDAGATASPRPTPSAGATPPPGTTAGTGTPGAGTGTAGRSPVVRATWSKTLSRADAQQPEDPTKTNITGVLRLAKAGNPIDWRTFFRQDLFGPASWAPSRDRQGNLIETASVPFHVTIGGASRGVIPLRVDHAPHREAGQYNVPTILHWGDALGPFLRSTPMHGHVVTWSSLSNGDYELTIA